MMIQTFNIANSDGSQRTIELKGRDAWALNELIKAGNKGCTPIDNPGPRWSAYVHKLRHVYGIEIETRHEAHKGPFPGTHARYILRSVVQFVETKQEAA